MRPWMWDAAVVLLVVAIYYTLVLRFARERVIPHVCRAATQHLAAARRRSSDEIETVATLTLSVLMQAGLLVVLAGLTSFRWHAFGGMPPVELLAAGAALGAGEMALATFLGLVAMRTVMVIAPAAPTRLHAWYALVNSGWMRLFHRAVEVLPPSLSFTLVGAYVLVEELIYRGVVLTVLLPSGPAVAVVLSTLLFAGYQVFNVPSLRGAMFPVIGALLMGIVHGTLFVMVPNVWPLAVAHVAFFATVARTFR